MKKRPFQVQPTDQKTHYSPSSLQKSGSNNKLAWLLLASLVSSSLAYGEEEPTTGGVSYKKLENKAEAVSLIENYLSYDIGTNFIRNTNLTIKGITFEADGFHPVKRVIYEWIGDRGYEKLPKNRSLDSLEATKIKRYQYGDYTIIVLKGEYDIELNIELSEFLDYYRKIKK